MIKLYSIDEHKTMFAKMILRMQLQKFRLNRKSRQQQNHLNLDMMAKNI